MTVSSLTSALTLVVLCLWSVDPTPVFAAGTAPTSGLVGYWAFDEPSGTTAIDASGNGNTGALSGTGLTRVAGRVGPGALNFSGSSGRVTVANAATLNLTSSYTIAVWVKPATTTASYQTAVLKGDTSACGYWLQTVSGHVSAGFGLNATCSSFHEAVATGSTLPVGSWSHVVTVFDNTANTQTVYVNGARVLSAPEASAPVASAEALVFGQSPYTSGANERWNGQLDEVRLYNRALSASEVAAVYTDTGAVSDSQAPSVPGGLTAMATSSSQIALSWAASSDNVGVTGYSIWRDGAALATRNATDFIDVGLAAQSTHSYVVAAFDAAGNVSAQSAAASATTAALTQSDAIAPAVTLTAPTSGGFVKGVVMVSASASDNVGVAGVQFLLDGAALGTEATTAPYAVSWPTTGAQDGPHVLSARARDAAGNTATAPARAVTVDNAAPSGTIVINGNAAATNSRTATLTLSATDAGSSVTQMRFANSGSTYSTAEAFATTKIWTLGSQGTTRTVSVQYMDASGNWSAAFTDSIRWDTTAPTISSVAATVTATGATIGWTTNEAATSRVEYGTTTAYGSSTALDSRLLTQHTIALASLAANTTYNYRVRSTDGAGNERVGSNATFKTSNTPDSTPPTVTLTQPVNGATVSGTVAVTATASDNRAVAGVQFYLDGAAFGAEDTTAPYQVSWTTTAVSAGAHTLTARARDTSNNTANAASITVTVDNRPDTTAPTTPTGLAASALGPTQVALSWVASTDAVGVTGYQVFRNGALIATAGGTSFTDTLLAPATVYVYAVAAYDAAGNVSPKTTDVSVTTPMTSTGYQYPLKIGPDGRSLVDQQGRPFFINGDTGWSLIAQLTRAEADTYLASRQQLGFNAVLANLIEHRFARNAPANIDGAPPFTSAGNFSTPNEAYFANADYMINKAAEKGMVVLLAPLYLGYACGNEGWCAEVQASSSATMRAWGRYVGNRYRNFPNIIWVIGGDVDPVANGIATKVREFVAGIKDYDTVHLITAHNGSEQSAMDVWPTESWLDLNDVYTHNSTYLKSLTEYDRTPFKPFFLIESVYENEQGSTPQSLRAEAYGAALSGATLGHLFGNCPIWGFGMTSGFCGPTDWVGQLNSTGARTVAYVGRLMASRSFTTLVPDEGHLVVTAGYSSGTNYAPASITADRSTLIAYIPTSRTVTVNLAKIAGTTARAWWFNPSTAQATLIGDFATGSAKTFTSPSSADWVLVIDNAALNLQAPGQ